MAIDVLLKRAGMFLVFFLAQTLVFGQIHLFGYAIPLLYVYFVLTFPRNFPKWASLLWSFALGLAIDIFYNTPGLAAASMTLIAALQPYVLEMLLSRDSSENLVPSPKSLGWDKYLYYSLMLVVTFCVVFFSLEAFSFYHFTEWFWSVVGSAGITMVLILTFESVAGRSS